MRSSGMVTVAVQLVVYAAAFQPPAVSWPVSKSSVLGLRMRIERKNSHEPAGCCPGSVPAGMELTRGAVLRCAGALLFKVLAAPLAVQARPFPAVFENVPPPVKALSTTEQVALAQHLKAIGAQFYGAYWCPYCSVQREMFGATGAKDLPYVECAEDGFQNSAGLCRGNKDLTGYPTWQINGKFYGGLKSLTALQMLSGFDASIKFAEYVPPGRAPPPPGGYKPPAVSTKSTPEQMALAQHLKGTGARFYGAYWCKFCNKQRQLFGAEAAATLPYLECAADGYQADTDALAKCELVTGYPTWEIGGKFYGGYKSLDALAKLSGFMPSATPANPSEAPTTVAGGGDDGLEGILRIEGLGGPVGKSDKDCTLSGGKMENGECKK